MDGASIKDLVPCTGAKLSDKIRTHLIAIIEKEFEAQTTLYQAKHKDLQERALEGYKKKVGFDKFKARIGALEDKKSKLVDQISQICDELYELGLDTYGQPKATRTNAKAYRELCTLLDRAAELDDKPRNYKNKVITMILLAQTVGEALVIAREVLGNDVIPSVAVKLLGDGTGK